MHAKWAPRCRPCTVTVPSAPPRHAVRVGRLPTPQRHCAGRSFTGCLEVAVPRLDAIHAHLKQYPWPARLPAEQSLLNLALALMEVSLAVESHGQPTVPFGFDPARLRVHL
jgi:hypothetical protein